LPESTRNINEGQIAAKLTLEEYYQPIIKNDKGKFE
jgi:hypothetical protein